MPEDMSATESVTGLEAAVPPNPPQPAQPSIDPQEIEVLKHKLGLANHHAKQAKKEKEELQKQFVELTEQLNSVREAQQSAVRENLEGQGAYKELYEQERARAKELETTLLTERAENARKLESVTQERAQEQLKNAALSAISQSNALNPNQLYPLLSPSLRQNEEGNAVVLNSGVEQPLQDYLSNLKQSNEWQHHFGASQGRGIGSAPAASSVAPGMSNPYVTRNLTERLRLEVENPALAQQLKAEASRG